VRGFPTIVMVNEENKGVKIVGARPLEYYVKGLEQVLEGRDVKAQSAPALVQVLAKEGLLFSKEIEVLYGVKREDVSAFVQKELAGTGYEAKEILGETYFVKV
jgi:putative protein-disulfide isomerase